MLNLLAKFTFVDSLISSLMGIAIVFIVLLILIGFIVAIRESIGFMAKNASKKNKQKESTPVVVAGEEDDAEVVAVVMAALQAYYDAANAGRKTKVGFVIKSIKRN